MYKYYLNKETNDLVRLEFADNGRLVVTELQCIDQEEELPNQDPAAFVVTTADISDLGLGKIKRVPNTQHARTCSLCGMPEHQKRTCPKSFVSTLGDPTGERVDKERYNDVRALMEDVGSSKEVADQTALPLAEVNMILASTSYNAYKSA
jgi:hypothetical protein